mmetsp:Transcript_11765/g.37323  ORF Transcript_11765/g.37323 Transcript_11765/m.37323 type:complete len:240 (+) Transcript_11765:2235-2954(+)
MSRAVRRTAVLSGSGMYDANEMRYRQMRSKLASSTNDTTSASRSTSSRRSTASGSALFDMKKETTTLASGKRSAAGSAWNRARASRVSGVLISRAALRAARSASASAFFRSVQVSSFLGAASALVSMASVPADALPPPALSACSFFFFFFFAFLPNSASATSRQFKHLEPSPCSHRDRGSTGSLLASGAVATMQRMHRAFGPWSQLVTTAETLPKLDGPDNDGVVAAAAADEDDDEGGE